MDHTIASSILLSRLRPGRCQEVAVLFPSLPFVSPAPFPKESLFISLPLWPRELSVLRIIPQGSCLRGLKRGDDVSSCKVLDRYVMMALGRASGSGKAGHWQGVGKGMQNVLDLQPKASTEFNSLW